MACSRNVDLRVCSDDVAYFVFFHTYYIWKLIFYENDF